MQLFYKITVLIDVTICLNQATYSFYI